jgi:hypothetical protein
MKAASMYTLLLAFLAVPSFGQQKTYDWVQGNDETVRLDPGYYHTSPPYQPASGARSMHVDVDAQQPVTLAVVSAQAWNNASQSPDVMGNLTLLCAQEHVVQTAYTCNLPMGTPMLLLVRDERGDRGRYAGRGEVTRGRDYDRQRQGPGVNTPEDSDSDRDRGQSALNRAIEAGVEAALGSRGRGQFSYPNEIHIQYYDFTCTANCNLPDPPRPKLFDWVPDPESERDRLDPGEFFHGYIWNLSDGSFTYHWDVQARWPVTLAMVAQQDWYDAWAQRNGLNLDNINYICIKQHVVMGTFQCHVEAATRPTFLVVLDERAPFPDDQYRQAGFSPAGQNVPLPPQVAASVAKSGGPAVPPVAGQNPGVAPKIGQPATLPTNQAAGPPVAQRVDHVAVQSSNQSSSVVTTVSANPVGAAGYMPRPFLAPNDIRVLLYHWKCVDACDQPDYQWQTQVDDKYYPSNTMLVYGGVVLPDHDSEQVSIHVKSPVPMAVAMVRAKAAGRLYGQPDQFEPTVENSACAQRGVQESTIACTFNIADGPQSLVLLPEAGAEIPPHKKVEVNVQSMQCADNCRGPNLNWAVVAHEKFQPTRFLKMYNGIIADHDGQHVIIKIKSPVPMSAAVLPSRQAGQLYGKLDRFDSEVKNSSCQQRNVQDSTLLCSFDIADGPQSLVLLPEPGYDLPRGKKAQVDIQAVKCVNGCGSP